MLKKTVHQLDDLTLLYIEANGIVSFTIVPTQTYGTALFTG